MGNSQSSENDSSSAILQTTTNFEDAKNFDVRWKRFIESLDVSSEHISQIELLDGKKKIELLLNYESKNPLCGALHYVALLKTYKINQILKKKIDCVPLRSLLSSIEISLRTNSVDWLYQFLEYEGLEAISDFVFQCLQYLSSSLAANNVTTKRNSNSVKPTELYKMKYELCQDRENLDYFESASCKANQISALVGPKIDGIFTYVPHENGSVKISPSYMIELIKDCLHLSLKCFKTILNNQKGCKRALDHPHIISLLTFCLLHPSYPTKTLTLDILTALCLIEGGHVKVLQAFDRLRFVMGEGLRFELLMTAFKYHELLDEEHYCIDFAVTCVQFLNIMVHSSENINLRVYLQYELHLLGLDDFLKSIRNSAGSRLKVQIEAYLDNRVDCSLLLEDAESKEAAVAEQERLEKQLHSEITQFKQLESIFKEKESELSELIESLRSQLDKLNKTGTENDANLKKQLNELQLALSLLSVENSELKNQIANFNKCESMKSYNSMCTSTHFESSSPTQITTSTNDNNNNVHHSNKNNLHNSLPMCSGQSVCISENSDVDKFDVNTSTHVRLSPSGSEASLSTDKNQPNTLGYEFQSFDNSKKSNLNLLDQSGSFQIDKPQKPPRKSPKEKLDIWSQLPQNLSTTRILATQATLLLTELAKSITLKLSTNNNMDNFILHPIGYNLNYSQINSQSDSIFNNLLFKKSLMITNLIQKTNDYNDMENADDFILKFCDQLPESWLNSFKLYKSYFNQTDDNIKLSRKYSTIDWLTNLGLLNMSYKQSDNELNYDLINNSKLFKLIIEFNLNFYLAQNLLSQCLYYSMNYENLQKSNISQLFNLIEQCFDNYHPDFNYKFTKYIYWPKTLSYLQANVMKHMFLSELQFMCENLSSLLEGCTSILVSSKLPLIIQLAWRLAAFLLIDFHSTGFELRSLNLFLDWNLPNDRQYSNHHNDQNTINSQNSHHREDRKSLKYSTFMYRFVNFIAKFAPNLLNWTSEMNHLETASKVSLDDIIAGIERMQAAMHVWQKWTETEYPNQSHNINPNINLSINEYEHLLNLMMKTSEIITTITISVAHWINSYSFNTNKRMSGNLNLPHDWLSPLVNFVNSFKRCAYDLDRKSRHLQNSSTTECHSHHRNQKRTKDSEKNNSSSGRKRENRHRKHRTRQLDADGLMDDILHGLTLNPLRTDIHNKRTGNLNDQRKSDE